MRACVMNELSLSGQRRLVLHVKPIMLGQVTYCDISEQCKRFYMKHFPLVTHSAVKFLLLTFTKNGRTLMASLTFFLLLAEVLVVGFRN